MNKNRTKELETGAGVNVQNMGIEGRYKRKIKEEEHIKVKQPKIDEYNVKLI